LRNQVNPHFLFNSFNTLSSLIEENQPRAVDYVHRLAGFFRNILTHREEDIVTLAEELALLEDYAALQHARYEDNLSISVDVENALLKKGIPPMTLQLLVENAIKHNIITRQHPLFVQIVSVGSETIEVSNAIQPRPTPPPSTGLGLENLDRKFALLKADAPKVSVDGNVFRVRISLVQKTPFA